VLRVVHYGLGPIGRSIASLVQKHPALEAGAAIDTDPTLRGLSLDAVLDSAPGPRSPRVVGTLAEAEIDGSVVAIHSTGSSLRMVLPQLLELIDAGLNVVSTCEELSFPDDGGPERLELDRRARDRGVAVLGTGVNPGFAMDYLPIALSGVMPNIEGVRVTRVQDAAQRRIPLQRKVGAGLTTKEFRARVDEGRLGHVGLRQSALALASAFGWVLSTYDEVIDPVIATAMTSSGVGDIEAGRVLGIHQVGRGSAGDRVVIRLDLTLAVGARDGVDRIVLLGDGELEMRIPRGLHGDVATAAIVVNAIPRVVSARPGLLTMADIAPPHPWIAA
jgi:hypothetical protein